jgi:hypothetical protein
MRAVEATATRLKDIDFSVNPTKVHIRKEYSKTRVARDIYISDEATQYLKQWIDWKYRDRAKEKDKGLAKTANPDDLVFSSYKINKRANPNNLYVKLYDEFQKLLAVVGMAERKENGIQKRRKITLHTFRRHAKSVISNQVNQDYSEWFLGHSKSPYYTLRMHTLQNIAQVYNIAVVITNQIQTNPDEWTNNSDIPVGGNIIAHSSTFRIRLHGSNPDKISAKLMTSPCYPQDDIRFAINDRGIADVTDD